MLLAPGEPVGPGRPAPTETAVIVPVPAAEPAVNHHRRRLDRSAGWGVPAHVTVLYPFVDPARVDDGVIHALGVAVRRVHSFGCRFARTRWFGAEVLWLDPEPSEPFRALTSAVREAFPDYPPYSGAHDDPTPHLTVAEVEVGGLAAVRAAELSVAGMLPIAAPIDRVLLVAGTQAPGAWHTVHEFTLAETPQTPHP